MNKNRILKVLRKIIEMIIPSISIIVLLISFLVGIISRYIIKSPQSWTYEIDSIAFFIAVMTSICLVNNSGEHVVFDMFYDNFNNKIKCIFRIISNILIFIFSIVLIPYSIKFIISMFDLKTQILKMPRWIPFVTFPVFLLSTALYSLLRMINDIRLFINKIYIETNEEAIK